MTTTRAVVFEQPSTIRFREFDMPDPGPNQVQVRTEFSTISAGTEGWALQSLFTWQATPFPCVPGYERVGIITALGEGVTDWQVGDRVMATVGHWESDVNSQWGSHLALANTYANELYQIPPGTDPIDASGAVVAQVGYNAASRAALSPGDWVVVYGDGIIGQCAAQAARARGARVAIVGHRAERLALARAHSADLAVDSREGDVAEALRAQTGAAHVRAVLDTVQTEAAQRQYQPLLEHGRGQVVYSGFTPGTTWADMAYLQQQELTAHFVSGWNRARMEETLALMAEGKMSLRPLVTHLVPPERGPEMYRMILEKSAPFLGITLDWR